MNITKIAQNYISLRPSVKDCLKEGLINHSALAREIGKRERIQNFQALLAAVKRYRPFLKGYAASEKKIIAVLKKSSLTIRNRIITIVIEKPRYFHDILFIEEKIKRSKGHLSLIEGTSVLTIVTTQEFLPLLKKHQANNILKINDGLVQIDISCPEEIETTFGVISHIFSLFSTHGINIVEEMSCWTDIMILIDEKDLSKALSFLKF